MEYYVGQSATFSKTITESDVYGFAGISGDFNPIHVNKIEAKKSIFREQIAHGMLSSSLISTVLGMYMPGPGTIYISQMLEFKAPVYIGTTITASAKIVELHEKGKATLETKVVDENEIVVIEGKAIVRLPRE